MDKVSDCMRTIHNLIIYFTELGSEPFSRVLDMQNPLAQQSLYYIRSQHSLVHPFSVPKTVLFDALACKAPDARVCNDTGRLSASDAAKEWQKEVWLYSLRLF